MAPVELVPEPRFLLCGAVRGCTDWHLGGSVSRETPARGTIRYAVVRAEMPIGNLIARRSPVQIVPPSDIVLQACPFASTALAAPDVICELHHGIAQGVAGRVGGIEVDDLVAKDPRKAQCRLRTHLTDQG